MWIYSCGDWNLRNGAKLDNRLTIMGDPQSLGLFPLLCIRSASKYVEA
jgi:hypothetical protein